MRRFTFITILALAMLFGTAQARDTGLVYHEIQVVDETNRDVTTISSVEIYAPDTTTDAVIYMDRNKQNTITLPMTTSSDNTTLSSGYFYWYGPDGYDYSVTDGTNVTTNANHRTRTSSDGEIQFPTYLTSTSTTTYTDAQSATFGTSSDWVFSAGAVADTFTAIPATTDTATFNIGSASYTADFRLFGSTSGYNLIWDTSENTLELLDNVTLAIGTGDDYTIVHNGTTTTVAGTTTYSGVSTFSTDVLYDGTYDVAWDDNRYQLLIEDNAVLGIGGAHDAAGDVTFVWDGTDLDIVPAADATIIKWGTGTVDVDMWWYGGAVGDYMLWDEGAAELCFYDAHLQLNDDATLIFGTGDDFTMYSDTADTLEIDPGAAGDQFYIGTAYTDAVDVTWFSDVSGAVMTLDEETGTVSFGATDTGLDVVFWGATALQKAWWDMSGDEWFFGADAEGVDVTFYGDTASSFAKWDENANTNGALIFDAADIEMGDGDFVQFGDGADLTVSATTTTTTMTLAAGSVLTIADTDNAASLLTLGTSGTNGLDVLFQGATAGDIVDWDAGADTWNFGVDATGVDVYFYGDTTLNWMLWDETNNVLSLDGGTSMLEFRGATSDAHETTLAVVEPTASNVITLPNIAIGTVELGTVATTAITADTTATITVVPGTDTLYTYTIDTDNEDCTLTFSAGGTAADRATIIFITDTGGGGDEIMTFDGTLAMSEGTLTLANATANRHVVEFISDGTVWMEVSRTAILP